MFSSVICAIRLVNYRHWRRNIEYHHRHFDGRRRAVSSSDQHDFSRIKPGHMIRVQPDPHWRYGAQDTFIMEGSSMVGPCSELVVLDFSWGMAGGLTTAVLADFGAEVVKIEPPSGDPFRSHPAWLAWNRGKKSAVLNLKTPEGREQAHQLAALANPPPDP
jgi:hypothetical protein